MKTDQFNRPNAPQLSVPFPKWRGVILTFVACLVIPAVITMVLCHARLTLTRTGDSVSAKVQHLIFLVIPYRSETLSELGKADATTIKGGYPRRKTGDTRRDRRTMDNGALTLTGAEGEIRIEIDPATGKEKQEAITAFLSGPQRSTHQEFIMGNRFFGWLFGIPATVLAALYVTGSLLAIGQWLLRGAKLLPPGRPV